MRCRLCLVVKTAVIHRISGPMARPFRIHATFVLQWLWVVSGQIADGSSLMQVVVELLYGLRPVDPDSGGGWPVAGIGDGDWLVSSSHRCSSAWPGLAGPAPSAARLVRSQRVHGA